MNYWYSRCGRESAILTSPHARVRDCGDFVLMEWLTAIHFSPSSASPLQLANDDLRFFLGDEAGGRPPISRNP
jgi:hypothetical protein